MFEDLKTSDWWFIGLAALAGFFIVKHFLGKLPSNLADAAQPSGSRSDGREDAKKRDDFTGFAGSTHQRGANDQNGWFRRAEQEERREREEKERKAAQQRSEQDAAARRRAEEEAAARSARSDDNTKPKPWYQILEVSSTASHDDIKQAYKRKIRQYHPDKVAGLGPEFTAIAEAKAKEINEAYLKACAARGR